MGGYGSGRPSRVPYTAEQVSSARIQTARRTCGLRYPGQGYLSVGGRIAELDWTPCYFGGHRPWFLCPRCDRRAGRLFLWGSELGCRQCFGLPYECQREGAFYRAIRREQKIRLRLGGGPSVGDPIPWKPKGMHWQTYERLTACIRKTSQEIVADCDAFIQRFQAGPVIHCRARPEARKPASDKCA